jgi:hypothetical protein
MLSSGKQNKPIVISVIACLTTPPSRRVEARPFN